MEKIIMIRYGELTTKKKNRDFFVNTLYNNIKKKLENCDYKIKKERARMYITSNNLTLVISKLKEVFGIHEIDIVYKLDSNDFEVVKNNIVEIFKDHDFKTFKVETNRADKNYEKDSMEISRIIGGCLLKNYSDLSVDVKNPDRVINIDVRCEGVFVVVSKIKGLGGYPVGVAGNALAMLSGGIDSPVSVYMAMKRGVHVDCIYFDSPPHTNELALNKVKKLVKILSKYDSKIKLYVVNFTKMQEEIYKNNANSYMITIMRRMMYRIASTYAKEMGYKLLINGESIGQVASQTLSSMYVINEVTNIPIIRPVACLDKIEIMEIARRIGTYETSILPYEDCCTIFLPKHPIINPKLSIVEAIESRFDYFKLIINTVDSIHEVKIDEVNNSLL